ncbi:MAG: hypothetical protein ACD_60C00153G0008 [uncultured bacterium]|nr:MAG: hypothetical protein ACD_60C00153G0008 [uncultured bacterium]
MAIRQSTLENMGITPDFWRKKRVFLTGHTGFKGSWLSLWLQALGANVTGYALPPKTEPNLFSLASIDQAVTSVFGDIRNLNFLKETITKAKPDIIFHLAAQPLVRYSYQHPVETYETNVMGTVNILEALRMSDSAKVLINITTDKCYENKEWHWGYREIDPMGGHDPYSNSKGCAELVTSAYRNSYFNAMDEENFQKGIASVRAGNIIGGGDWSDDRLIPDMMKAFMKGKKPLIRFPNAIRPWQHVLEPLFGYLLLAEKIFFAPKQYAEAWNFGPHDKECQPVSSVANQVCEVWGDNAAWEQSTEQHAHEASFLKLDIAKAQSRLHWHPRFTLQEAIDATVSWYKSWQRGDHMRDVTLAQIERYNHFKTEQHYA